MSSTNLGGQIVSFKFGQEATSETFNRIFYNTFPQGIYDGATLSDADSLTNRVTINPGTYIFNDPEYDKIVDLEPYIDGVAVKIQQTLAIADFQISTTNPYVIAYFTWENVSENYITFEAASLATINALISAGTPPVIIGRGTFISGVLQPEFDYTRRTVPSFIKTKDRSNELRILSDTDGAGPSGGKGVFVTAGNVVINNRLVTWDGGYYNPDPAIPDSVQSRIDIIFLDRNGALQHRLGVEHPSNPQAPKYPKNGVVLAEIRRGQNRTTINGSEIFNIDLDRYVTNDLVWGIETIDVNATHIPLGATINRIVPGGSDIVLPSSSNIETTLQLLIDRFYDMSGVANESVLARHLGLGVGGGAISAEAIPIEDAADRFPVNNVEAALVALSNNAFTFYGSKTFDSTVNAPSFNATSSKVYKENIEPLEESALTILSDTDIVTFNFKEDEQKNLKIGFIAEDTHPYLSTSTKDQLDISNAIGLLIKAVQELRKENQELQTKVDLLSYQLNKG